MNLITAILLSTIILAVEPSKIDPNQHFIGEVFGGGIIFQLDETKMHGLVCSLSDIRDPLIQPISNYSDTASNLSSSISNPERALDLCSAYINSDFGTGRFSDWFLPNIDELKMLYQARNIVNESLKKHNPKIVDYLNKKYWSSSKVKTDLIPANQILDFENGVLIVFPNRSETFVRAVRKF